MLNSAGLKVSTRDSVEANIFSEMDTAASNITDNCFTTAEKVEVLM